MVRFQQTGSSLLRKMWLDRLEKEYAAIQFTHRLKLRPPLLEITPLSGRWGLWDPVARTLTLSEQLIQQYSWDMVLEVFKHEIAHQITSECYGSDELHGPLFRKACAALGTAEWACRAETDFDELFALSQKSATGGAEERLFSRIEKLLALATSSNEHEALLAMQKVQELYSKYQMDRIEAQQSTQFISKTVSFRRKRIERHQYLACSVLNDHFFVRVVFTSLYDASDLCEYRAFEMMGTRESVKMAEYVFHFLQQQSLSLWEQYRAPLRKRRRAKNSFLLGVLSGFRDKLEKEARERAAPQPTTSKTNALVILEDKQLEQFVSYRFPRIHSVRQGSRLRDADSYDAGVTEGKKLILRKGIEENLGNQRKLLR